MVKETKYDHHPVRIVKGLALGTEQEWGGLVQLDTKDAAVLAAAGSDDVSWSLLSLASNNPPANAVAAILEVEVNDAGSSGEDTHMRVAKPGIIIASRTQYIPCGHVNDMIGAKTCIVELSDDYKFAYMVQASGAVFDYNIKLIGWIIDPQVTRSSMPSEDFKAVFTVNQ